MSPGTRKDRERIDELCSRAPRYALFTRARRACALEVPPRAMDWPDSLVEAMAGIRDVLLSKEEISEETLVRALLHVRRVTEIASSSGLRTRDLVEFLAEEGREDVLRLLLAAEVMLS